MCLLKGAGEDTSKMFAGEIVKSGERLLTLIEDVIRFSNLYENEMVFDPRDVEPEHFMKDIRDSFKTQASARGISIVTNIKQDQSSLHSDPILARQILTNLMSNAPKFSKRNTRTVAIEPTGYFCSTAPQGSG